MILKGWKIRTNGEGFEALEVRMGRGGLGERVNDETGNRITGSLVEVYEKLERLGMSPSSVCLPDCIEFWW